VLTSSNIVIKLYQLR